MYPIPLDEFFLIFYVYYRFCIHIGLRVVEKSSHNPTVFEFHFSCFTIRLVLWTSSRTRHISCRRTPAADPCLTVSITYLLSTDTLIETGTWDKKWRNFWKKMRILPSGFKIVENQSGWYNQSRIFVAKATLCIVLETRDFQHFFYSISIPPLECKQKPFFFLSRSGEKQWVWVSETYQTNMNTKKIETADRTKDYVYW